MQILITGAAGIAGQAVTRQLKADGKHSIRLADLVAPPAAVREGCEFVRCDTRTREDVDAAEFVRPGAHEPDFVDGRRRVDGRGACEGGTQHPHRDRVVLMDRALVHDLDAGRADFVREIQQLFTQARVRR